MIIFVYKIPIEPNFNMNQKMMHLGDEDDEFCSTSYKKSTKIIKKFVKFGYGSP
jgi:hypothetical protein